MIYHLRYWREVVWRWLRWPFCKWVRQGHRQFEEVLAEYMCDPEFRKMWFEEKRRRKALRELTRQAQDLKMGY